MAETLQGLAGVAHTVLGHELLDFGHSIRNFNSFLIKHLQYLVATCHKIVTLRHRTVTWRKKSLEFDGVCNGNRKPRRIFSQTHCRCEIKH